jgi:hypothetical protein
MRKYTDCTLHFDQKIGPLPNWCYSLSEIVNVLISLPSRNTYRVAFSSQSTNLGSFVVRMRPFHLMSKWVKRRSPKDCDGNKLSTQDLIVDGRTESIILSASGARHKACPDWHASALNFSFSHCMSLLNFISEFLECFGKVDACHSGQTLILWRTKTVDAGFNCRGTNIVNNCSRNTIY